MKIFNWMYHMLQPSAKYSQISQEKDVSGGDNREKQEVIFQSLMEKEALLFHDALNSILTIGTLGHQDSFLSQSCLTHEDELQEEEENVEEEATEGMEVSPIVVASEPLPSIDSFKFKLPVEAEGKTIEMVVQDVEEAEKIQEVPLLQEDKDKRERRRTTLANLFAAADALVENDNAENANKEINAIFKQHAGTSDRKNLQKNKKEEKWSSATTKANTTTARKLQNLITKVLKKKIHPEMGVLPKVADMQMKETMEPLMVGGAESIELVQV